MSKTDLENYYVEDRDKRHFNCYEVIGCIFVGLLFVFAIGMVGYLACLDTIEHNVEDSLIITANEICPILGEGYESERFYKGYSYDIDRIRCDEYNSNPNPLD